MIKNKTMITLILAICIILTSFSGIALASDGQEKFDTTIEELVKYNIAINSSIGYDMTKKEIEEYKIDLQYAIDSISERQKTTKYDVAKAMLQEYKNEQLENQKAEGSSKSRGYDEVQLPKGQTIGTIYWSNMQTPWNHVGIYKKSNYIVEAMPGSDEGVEYLRVTNSDSYQDVKDDNSSVLMYVSGVTTTQRSNTAKWAYDQVDDTYDYDFLDNKRDGYYIYVQGVGLVYIDENASFNCSELVWKAYKKKASVDIDSNGGLAVYPNNIKNSSLTVVKGNY